MNRSVFLAICLCQAMSSTHAADMVKVYAAASLTNAMSDITKIYQIQHPKTKIRSVFGATSRLSRQVEAGASTDIFFSADSEWMNYLVQKNKIDANQVNALLLNQLVLISPKNLNISIKVQPNFNFAQAFKGHLCTAQMESVPAGQYAKQSLIHLNWFKHVKGRIVGTDDVRAALAFVERGECEVGIVYKTDALMSAKIKIIGVFPAHSHRPIIYPVALTQQGRLNKRAVDFEHFVRHSPQAKAIFQKYGFKFSLK